MLNPAKGCARIQKAGHCLSWPWCKSSFDRIGDTGGLSNIGGKAHSSANHYLRFKKQR